MENLISTTSIMVASKDQISCDLEAYDVEADPCSRDLLQLLADLHAHGLIQVLDEPASHDRGSDEKNS